MTHGYVSGSNIQYHFWNKKRIETRRTVAFRKIHNFFLESHYTTNATTKGTLTVALDLNISPELVQEGDAREFINRIQKIRKDSNFELTDRVVVQVEANNGIKESLAKYNNYICAEILADKLEFSTKMTDGMEIDVNDKLLKVIVLKKG